MHSAGNELTKRLQKARDKQAAGKAADGDEGEEEESSEKKSLKE